MARGEGRAPFPLRAAPFIWYYILRRRWLFAALFLVMVSAAAFAVAVQLGMRLLVDAMSLHTEDRSATWFPLLLFVALIGLESACWRVGGWLTCRGVVSTGVAIRLDLFEHLSGHPMRYFSDHLAGSLGGRITATAGSVAGLLTTISWSILPPCADFVGAFVLFLTFGRSAAAAGIARAILKSAPILVLYEATSALDSRSEAMIQEAMATLMRGRTVVAIAHRLSTIASLDRIIVLGDGRIVEDGSPTELLGCDGAFQTLWRLQADSFGVDQGRVAA